MVDITNAESPPAAARGARAGRRSGGRAGNQRRGGGGVGHITGQWHIPRRLDPPIEPLSAEQLETVFDAAYKVLETIGLEFMHAEARTILKKAGANVDEDTHRARIPREIVIEAMKSAPAEFTVTPRNPERVLPMGGNATVFAPIGSAPNCSDLDHGRRPGNTADFQKFVKLAQSFDCLHTIGGYPVEPIDIHPSIRCLEAVSQKLILTDKAMHVYSLGEAYVEDGMEMVRLAAGLTEDEFCATPRMYTNINTNSPLKVDIPMMDGPLRLARRGQAVIITPFTLAGAMAPVTVLGAIVQQTAEFLGVATVLQLAAPGTPVVMGGFVSNVDMKSGAPAFGTPEFMRGAQVGGQIARRLGVPFRASNVNASNAVDAQSTWESAFSLWGILTGGVNYVLHGAGWLEGGLVASFEKYVIDCEMIQWLNAYLKPLEFNEDALGLEAMAEVGPGGHFFGCAHTQARYENAFHAPFLADWRNFQSWEEDGALNATQRANRIYKEVLDAYREPPMDSDARGALEDYVGRRIAEGGSPTDF
ncbi:MAG: trimethylamine methyltransferase family protein [Pseudomonadota bacterium]